MLTPTEKTLLETTLDTLILANQRAGRRTYTYTLNPTVYNMLISRIPGLNMHHSAGMLSKVCRTRKCPVNRPGHYIA